MGGSQIVHLVSHSHKAIKLRQKSLNKEHSVINLHGITADGLQKKLKKQALVNKGERLWGDGYETVHTLLRDKLVPIRHQVMSREKAMKLNEENRKLGINLYWLMGKQEIKSHT